MQQNHLHIDPNTQLVKGQQQNLNAVIKTDSFQDRGHATQKNTVIMEVADGQNSIQGQSKKNFEQFHNNCLIQQQRSNRQAQQQEEQQQQGEQQKKISISRKQQQLQNDQNHYQKQYQRQQQQQKQQQHQQHLNAQQHEHQQHRQPHQQQNRQLQLQLSYQQRQKNQQCHNQQIQTAPIRQQTEHNIQHTDNIKQNLNTNQTGVPKQRKPKKSFTTITTQQPITTQDKNNTPKIKLPKILSAQKENNFNHNQQSHQPNSKVKMLRSKSNYSLLSSNSCDQYKKNAFTVIEKPPARQPKHHLTQVDNYSYVDGKKVYMSGEDFAILKRLKLQYQRREQKIHQKIQQHERQLQQRKMEKKRQQLLKIERQRQQRKRSAQQREQQRSLKRLQKHQLFKEQNRKLKEVLSKQKLYQKMENSFVKKSQQQKILRQSIFKQESSKIRKKVDYDQIKQSARNYSENRSIRIQESKKRLRSSLQNLKQEFQNMNIYRSRFYSQVKNQTKQLNFSRLITQTKPLQYKQRVKEYQNKVKENHLPRKQLKLQIKKEEKKVLCHKDIFQIGNQNMRLANSRASRQKEKSLNKSLISNRKRSISKQLEEITGQQNKSGEEKYRQMRNLQQEMSKEYRKKESLKLGQKESVGREIEEIGMKMRIMEGLVSQ